MLKKWTGTTERGTSLLGLREASIKLGLPAEGYEGNIEELKKHNRVTILHVVVDEKLLHYVVCYGYNGTHFLIGDPAQGVLEILPESLDKIWKTKRLLLFSEKLDTTALNRVGRSAGDRKRVSIWKVLEDDTRVIILSCILGSIVAFLGLSLAVFSQVFFDEILSDDLGRDKVVVALLLLVTTFFLKNAVTFLRDITLLRQSKNLGKRMSHLFYGRLLNLPISFYQSMQFGDLVARLNDATRLQNAINYFFSSLAIDVLMFASLVGFVFLTSQILAATIVLLSVLFLLVSAFQTKRIVHEQGKLIKSHGLTETNYINALQSIEAIKLHNRESFFGKYAGELFGLFQEQLFRLGLVRSTHDFVNAVFASLLIIVTVFVSSEMYFRGEVTLGSLVALMQVSLLIVPSITSISVVNLRWRDAKTTFDRLNEIAVTQPEYSADEDNTKVVIQRFERLEIASLCYRFPGTTKKIVENLTLDVYRGDFIGILGKSECGKSTLVKILQKFYAVPSHTIFVNGLEWENLSFYHWRNVIGVVPQEIMLLNTSIAGNISMDETTDLLVMQNFCSELGIDKYFTNMLDGYTTIVGDSATKLSGGQKQLIGLARALFKRPQLLFLDEATSFLDTETQTQVFDLLRRMCSKKEVTIFFVSRNKTLVEFADKVITIN